VLMPCVRLANPNSDWNEHSKISPDRIERKTQVDKWILSLLFWNLLLFNRHLYTFCFRILV